MCRFHRAREAGELHEVGMNEVGLMFYDQYKHATLGCQNMNGGTAVAIISPKACVMAFIGPLPFVTTDDKAGDAHVEAKMDKLLTYHHRFPLYFPRDECRALILGAQTDGDYCLPFQIDLMRGRLNKKGLFPVSLSYEAHRERHTKDKEGTVFIDAKSPSDGVKVYVEDEEANV